LINKTIGFYTSTFETRDGISESVKKLRDQGSGLRDQILPCRKTKVR